MNKKIYFAVFVIIVIVILACYFLWFLPNFFHELQVQHSIPTLNKTENYLVPDNISVPSKNQIPTQATTTNEWATYQSKEYGLKFNYPTNWKTAPDYGFIQLQTKDSIAGGITIIKKPITSPIDTFYESMFSSATQCPDIAGTRNLSSESQYEEYVYCLTGKEIPMTAGTWKGAVECPTSAWYGEKVDPETCPHEFWINTDKFFYVVFFNLFEPIEKGSEIDKFIEKFLKGFSFF